jgi:glycosyltransferase involved in cell wall biosynthesis
MTKPKISVITPTYNTPKEILARTWASLKRQTFTDWEWVVWDDSISHNVWDQLYGLASDERYRISAHRSLVHSGKIGEVKRNGFMVAQGQLLVELDHDDELFPTALQEISDAADQGHSFIFSDWCEILPDGTSGKYPEGWGLGFGQNVWNEQHQLWQLSLPIMSADSMKHIVGVPNHVRVWDSDFYREIGGHDPSLDVCDDYDLILRTFKGGSDHWHHINQLLYKQHISPKTAQRQKNARIQELVPVLYERHFSEKP